jgi:hypothetical protein
MQVAFRCPDAFLEMDEIERQSRCWGQESTDFLQIDRTRNFIRGILPIPINGYSHDFAWGVWAAVPAEKLVYYSPYFRGCRPRSSARAPAAFRSQRAVGLRRRPRARCERLETAKAPTSVGAFVRPLPGLRPATATPVPLGADSRGAADVAWHAGLATTIVHPHHLLSCAQHTSRADHAAKQYRRAPPCDYLAPMRE